MNKIYYVFLYWKYSSNVQKFIQIKTIQPWTFESVIYCSLLVMMKDSNENIYCDIDVKIFIFFNKFLYDPILRTSDCSYYFFLQFEYMNTVWRITAT